MRVLICGGPKVGKTTLATKLGEEHDIIPRSTDSLIGKLEWSDASVAVALWMSEPGSYIIEGVSVVRALRKWMKSNPLGVPCDQIVHLTETHQTLTPGQLSMTLGHQKIWQEVLSELSKRGKSHIIQSGT